MKLNILRYFPLFQIKLELVHLQSLSQENLSPEEDDKDSNEDIIGVDEDSYDGMFSTEADTAEVSAVEFIVDDYYEHEVTLENPIAYFEDIEDDGDDMDLRTGRIQKERRR